MHMQTCSLNIFFSFLFQEFRWRFEAWKLECELMNKYIIVQVYTK